MGPGPAQGPSSLNPLAGCPSELQPLSPLPPSRARPAGTSPASLHVCPLSPRVAQASLVAASGQAGQQESIWVASLLVTPMAPGGREQWRAGVGGESKGLGHTLLTQDWAESCLVS